MKSHQKQPRLPLATGRSKPPAPPETISGTVQRVTYHDENTGFCVLRVRPPDSADPLTVVGRSNHVAPGHTVRAHGSWQEDATYGRQFRSDSLELAEPNSPEDMESYLASGRIRGVGPALARRLIEAFGADVFEVISNQPERLQEVDGLGPVRVERLAESWNEQNRVHEIMMFLHTHGLGPARASRIHALYGDHAIETLRSNPYTLVQDIHGIGFATADALARSLGTHADDPSRLNAGLLHVLDNSRQRGHCGLPREDLLESAANLLETGSDTLSQPLTELIQKGDIVAETIRGHPCCFLPDLFRLERECAERLISLTRGVPTWNASNPSQALDQAASRLAIELAPSQREALSHALESRLLVVTGGPGVGKTTIVRVLLEVLEDHGVRAVLAAPTGRAARRIRESTGREAQTLHRLLEVDAHRGRFQRDTNNPLDCDLVIVDEASMIDVPLTAALLRALPDHASLLLIGDSDQLPSVGPGQVCADLIRSRTVPVAQLREVFRQEAQSTIVQNAHLVNQGTVPESERDPDGEFFFIETENSQRIAARLIEVVQERIPARFGLDPIRDVQVLCPMRRGPLGTFELGQEIQNRLNPTSSIRARVERSGVRFSQGDKVIQRVNDYEREVFNGDVGIVHGIDEIEQQLTIDFEGRQVFYPFEALENIALAYAITVHKAQGSEYPAVVMPLTTGHHIMLQRNLLYTAITRARKLVVLVGQRNALERAVSENEGLRRWTKLTEWLDSPTEPGLATG
ncbi:ATP-dependent RecD-like DNA helicase [Myxococcota bacterium]|nr:ATP-dependent RecD-like DNA helicase [Myxococcota bacterium]